MNVDSSYFEHVVIREYLVRVFVGYLVLYSIHFEDQLEKNFQLQWMTRKVWLPISFSNCFSRKRALSTVNSIIFFIWKKFNAAAALGKTADDDDDDDDEVAACSLVGEDVSVDVIERSIGFINRSNW